MLSDLKVPSVLIDSKPVITRPAINSEIEVLERIFLFPSRNGASAIVATVDGIDRIVEIALNIIGSVASPRFLVHSSC